VPAGARWSRPEGGLFLWVSLPESIDGAELFAAACERGVLYSRGELFHSDGSGHNQLRLTYSAASPPRIEEGIAILGSLVRERLDRSEPERLETIEAMPIL
jgi:DNA-binding transcriptional MocR family regulator